MTAPDLILQAAQGRPTPFYLYDLDLLEKTVRSAASAARCNPKFRLHYALKANYNAPVLNIIKQARLGLDAVSGGEIAIGIENGFDADDILFAGVGKTDSEIDFALAAGIGAFNIESLPELEVIDQRARKLDTTASVCIRINPEIDAHTHHYITTGLAENKFGINLSSLDRAVDMALSLRNIQFAGLHFHIGSQITIAEPFAVLCERVNRIVAHLADRSIRVSSLDMGGGLAIDYDNPHANPVPDFDSYFKVFADNLDTDTIDTVHFELGRSLVGQCGVLVSKVLYVKEGDTRKFAVIDAGMTELIRPALYGARHNIVNVSGDIRGDGIDTVDVVGPVCESSDVFGRDYTIAAPRRGDIVAVESAGAYGEVMSSRYNARRLNDAVYVKDGKIVD